MAVSQLMCICTADYCGSARQVIDARDEFDQLFTDVGCVHFAAFALLPPPPEGGPTALVLELAVDPGIAPDELLERLIQHGLGALLAIYECCLDSPPRSSELVIEDRLRTFLRPRIQLADGGFVGARDRTVGQIRSEGALYQAAREYLQQNPPRNEERRDVARRLADWAIDHPEWAWAATPPPRSFWRSPSLSLPLRGVLLLALAEAPMPGTAIPGFALFGVVLLTLAALASTGVLALVPFAAVFDWDWYTLLARLFGDDVHRAWWVAGAAVGATALTVLGYLAMIATARLVTVAALFMLVIGTALALSLAVIAAILAVQDMEALFGLVRAAEVLVRVGVLALVAFAALWVGIGVIWFIAVLLAPPYFGTAGVIGIALVLSVATAWAIHWGLAALVGYGDAHSLGLYPKLSVTSWAGVPALDMIVVLEFLVFTLLTIFLSRSVKLPPFLRFEVAKRLDTIDGTRELVRGHQLHSTIVACDAELAQGRVSHMFSLTEVKPNVRVNRWLMRYFLRLVTLVGHTIFTEGKLAHAEGIRFGHWYVIDGKRLLFCSNYDGGFGGYLDEFINGASEGINLFWRWTRLRRRAAAADGHPAVEHDRDFPPTKLWVFRGCKYEQWFKTYARDSMLPHLYRFEAYCYTAADVQRATRFREALFGLRTAVNDDQLLRALES